MNDIFNEQKEILVSIKKEISLLHQQVDYLIRNEQPLGLLDLDVMMNRTHTLYDKLCSINLGKEEDEELPVGEEEIRKLFGVENGKRNPEGLTDRTGGKTESEEEEVESGEEEEEDEISEENESAYFIEDIDDVADDAVADEETQLEPEPKPELEPETEPETEPEPEPEPEPETESEEEPAHNSSDDLGFILNFEPVSEEPQQNEEPQQSEEPQPSETPTEEVKEEPTVFTSGDEIEMEVKDEELEEGSKEEEEIKNEEEEVKYEEEVKEEEIVYEPVVIGDMTDHDDSGFELEQPETVGERYQQGQEETVGERLQHSSVRDLQSAIGINDKFLFVNELFGGSMEKYNRSIENLNDLKTLNGALIYLNELRIELQWNSSNEAYKKLLELVHRKFES